MVGVYCFHLMMATRGTHGSRILWILYVYWNYT